MFILLQYVSTEKPSNTKNVRYFTAW